MTYELKFQKELKSISINEKTLLFVSSDLSGLFLYVKKLKQQYGFSIEEAKSFIKNEMNEFQEEFTQEINSISGLQIQKILLQDLLHDHDLFLKTYQQVISDPPDSTDYLFTYDRQKGIPQLVSNFVLEQRSHVEDRKRNSSNQDFFRQLEHTEYSHLLKNLPFFDTLFDQQSKVHYIKLLLLMGDFFRKYDLLSKYHSLDNSTLSMLGYPDLCYSFSVENSSSDSFGVDDFFKEDILSPLSSTALCAANIFWQNRFAKAMDSISTSVFIADQLNLWEKGVEDPKGLSIDPTLLLEILKKKEILSRMSSIIHKEIVQKELQKENRDSALGTYNSDDIEKIAKDSIIINPFEYEDYYQSYTPNHTNWLDDLKKYTFSYISLRNTYIAKDSSSINLCHSIMNKKEIRNWGYIPDANTPNKFLLLGFDCPKFNRPLKIHINKDLFLSTLLSMEKDPIIPIYEGAKDFYMSGKHSSLHVFLPMTKSQKSTIKETARRPLQGVYPESKNSLAHLLFLVNSKKFPTHLTDGKNRKKRIINLKTNQTYQHVNGKLIELSTFSDIKE